MTLSRTARILLALMLLAAAAFFWVNFFTQSRIIAEEGEPPTTAAAPSVATPAAAVAEAEAADTAADTAADAEAGAEPAADVAAAVAVAEPEADVNGDAEADGPVVVTARAEDDPVVVIDPPLTVARDVEVAEFPFLVTEPPAPLPADPTAIDPLAAERALAAARATVNPFSPIVVRRETAPVRDVPAAPVVTEVAVPTGPPPEPPRVATPAPRALAPTPVVSPDLPPALPSGTPLAATPSLLQEPRTIDSIDRAPVPEIVVTRLPEESNEAPVVEAVRAGDSIAADVPELRGTEEEAEEAAVVAAAVVDAPVVAAMPAAGQAPLAAGTNRLARYLRDNGYSFTGSVLGPVSVGIFRSNADPAPQVVALGQTLPNTEIVLTDLRGQQAELTLDDLSQILILDIRR